MECEIEIVKSVGRGFTQKITIVPGVELRTR